MEKIYSKIGNYISNAREICNIVIVRYIDRRVLSYIATTIVIAFIIGGMILSSDPSTTETTSSPKKSNNGGFFSRKKGLNAHLTNEMSDLEQTKVFDKEIESFLSRWEITGGSFALMRDDKLIYAKGYGYADKERGIKCDVGHTLRLASASKLITAAAIMKLIEQKKLTLKSKVFGEEGILNDPKFLNIKDRDIKSITVEHLLRHTSGFATPIKDPAFGNYSVARALNKKLPLTVDDMVIYSTMFELNGRPGDRYKYSNLGYIILGKVIEQVSDTSYEKYVQENLMKPIGCYDIYIGQNFERDRGSNEVNYYEVKEAELGEAYDGSGKMVLSSNGGNNVTLLSSAGGWVASPVEMLRFVASINNTGSKKDILSSESVAAMTYDSRNYKPMGWATVRGAEWLRSGSMAGTCTLIKKQKDGYTWIFVTNSSAWIGYHLSNKISSHISRAITKVKEWPNRDLFTE